MIITQNNKYIMKDYDTLFELTNNFMEFRKHNEEFSKTLRQEMYKYENKRYNSSLRKSKKTGSLYAHSKRISDFYTPSKQARIQNCNSWGTFIKFLDGNQEIKQTKSNACNCALLCPFCASRKASKQQNLLENFFMCFDENLNKEVEDKNDINNIINTVYHKDIDEDFKAKIQNIKNEYGNILDLNWYFSVLTVKNSSDIQEVFQHLKHSFNEIRERIKRYKRRNIDTFFKWLGAVYSVEITYRNGKYHPHINVLFAVKDEIKDIKTYTKKWGKNKNYSNSETLSNEWKEITKDSFITSCVKIDVSNFDELKKNLMEIIKYSLKFNSIPHKNLVQIYPYLYKQRMFGTLGFFYGLGLSEIKFKDFTNDDNRYYVKFVMYLDKHKIYNFKEEKEEKDIIVNDEFETESINILRNTNPLLSQKDISIENLKSYLLKTWEFKSGGSFNFSPLNDEEMQNAMEIQKEVHNILSEDNLKFKKDLEEFNKKFQNIENIGII